MVFGILIFVNIQFDLQSETWLNFNACLLANMRRQYFTAFPAN